MGTKKRLHELFQLYLESAASEQELEELFHLSTLAEYEAEFQTLLANAWDKLEEVGFALPITSDGKETARIINFPAPWRGGKQKHDAGSRGSRRAKIWARIAVAAILITAISLSVFFYTSVVTSKEELTPTDTRRSRVLTPHASPKNSPVTK